MSVRSKKSRRDDDADDVHLSADEVVATDLVLPKSVRVWRRNENYFTTLNWGFDYSTSYWFEYNDGGGGNGNGASYYNQCPASVAVTPRVPFPVLWNASLGTGGAPANSWLGMQYGCNTLVKQSLNRVPLGASSSNRQTRMIVIRRIEVKMLVQQFPLYYTGTTTAQPASPFSIVRLQLILDRQFNGQITMPSVLNSLLYEANPVGASSGNTMINGGVLAFVNRGQVGRFIILKEQYVDLNQKGGSTANSYLIGQSTLTQPSLPSPQCRYVYWDLDDVVIPITFNDGYVLSGGEPNTSTGGLPVDTISWPWTSPGVPLGSFVGGNCLLQSVTSNNLMVVASYVGDGYRVAVPCATRITFENVS